MCTASSSQKAPKMPTLLKCSEFEVVNIFFVFWLGGGAQALSFPHSEEGNSSRQQPAQNWLNRQICL